jgi:general stress protein 26
MKPELSKLSDLIKEIQVAMMTTIGENDELHSRPMMAQQIDAEGCLWFFTSTETGKVQSIRNDQRINLAYASPKDSKFVSVGGTASIVKDEAKAKELWNPAMKAWFPKGVNEADLVLIKVQLDSAEYWDAPAGKMVQLLKMAKAVMTGQRYEASAREHGRVVLH